ncbi:hypothetical protein ACFSX9_13955 [Flavobacterium ardleyense]|uniref:Uncharacterized protein n=1 Tax=Flavobacterium ardleyense TaxID=2038737 RepID=A0ABW5ZAP3_9FLAO
MKTLNTSKVLFFLSLFAFLTSFYLLVSFPDSGRFSLIAGAVVSIALGLNIGAYFSKIK